MRYASVASVAFAPISSGSAVVALLRPTISVEVAASQPRTSTALAPSIPLARTPSRSSDGVPFHESEMAGVPSAGRGRNVS